MQLVTVGGNGGQSSGGSGGSGGGSSTPLITGNWDMSVRGPDIVSAATVPVSAILTPGGEGLEEYVGLSHDPEAEYSGDIGFWAVKGDHALKATGVKLMKVKLPHRSSSSDTRDTACFVVMEPGASLDDMLAALIDGTAPTTPMKAFIISMSLPKTGSNLYSEVGWLAINGQSLVSGSTGIYRAEGAVMRFAFDFEQSRIVLVNDTTGSSLGIDVPLTMFKKTDTLVPLVSIGGGLLSGAPFENGGDIMVNFQSEPLLGIGTGFIEQTDSVKPSGAGASKVYKVTQPGEYLGYKSSIGDLAFFRDATLVNWLPKSVATGGIAGYWDMTGASVDAAPGTSSTKLLAIDHLDEEDDGSYTMYPDGSSTFMMCQADAPTFARTGWVESSLVVPKLEADDNPYATALIFSTTDFVVENLLGATFNGLLLYCLITGSGITAMVSNRGTTNYLNLSEVEFKEQDEITFMVSLTLGKLYYRINGGSLTEVSGLTPLDVGSLKQEEGIIVSALVGFIGPGVLTNGLNFRLSDRRAQYLPLTTNAGVQGLDTEDCVGVGSVVPSEDVEDGLLMVPQAPLAFGQQMYVRIAGIFENKGIRSVSWVDNGGSGDMAQFTGNTKLLILPASYPIGQYLAFLEANFDAEEPTDAAPGLRALELGYDQPSGALQWRYFPTEEYAAREENAVSGQGSNPMEKRYLSVNLDSGYMQVAADGLTVEPETGMGASLTSVIGVLSSTARPFEDMTDLKAYLVLSFGEASPAATPGTHPLTGDTDAVGTLGDDTLPVSGDAGNVLDYAVTGLGAGKKVAINQAAAEGGTFMLHETKYRYVQMLVEGFPHDNVESHPVIDYRGFGMGLAWYDGDTGEFIDKLELLLTFDWGYYYRLTVNPSMDLSNAWYTGCRLTLALAPYGTVYLARDYTAIGAIPGVSIPAGAKIEPYLFAYDGDADSAAAVFENNRVKARLFTSVPEITWYVYPDEDVSNKLDMYDNPINAGIPPGYGQVGYPEALGAAYLPNFDAPHRKGFSGTGPAEYPEGAADGKAYVVNATGYLDNYFSRLGDKVEFFDGMKLRYSRNPDMEVIATKADVAVAKAEALAQLPIVFVDGVYDNPASVGYGHSCIISPYGWGDASGKAGWIGTKNPNGSSPAYTYTPPFPGQQVAVRYQDAWYRYVAFTATYFGEDIANESTAMLADDAVAPYVRATLMNVGWVASKADPMLDFVLRDGKGIGYSIVQDAQTLNIEVPRDQYAYVTLETPDGYPYPYEGVTSMVLQFRPTVRPGYGSGNFDPKATQEGVVGIRVHGAGGNKVTVTVMNDNGIVGIEGSNQGVPDLVLTIPNGETETVAWFRWQYVNKMLKMERIDSSADTYNENVLDSTVVTVPLYAQVVDIKGAVPETPVDLLALMIPRAGMDAGRAVLVVKTDVDLTNVSVLQTHAGAPGGETVVVPTTLTAGTHFFHRDKASVSYLGKLS